MTKTMTRVMLAVGFLATCPICPLAASTPFKPGTISFEVSSVHPASGYSVNTFVDAIGEALSTRDFIILESRGHARLVAEVALSQTDIGTANTKVPPAEGPKITAGGVAGVGGGITVPLPSSKLMTVPILKTVLQVRIKRLGEDDVLWVGAALTVRPSNYGAGREKVVAADLARAIFRNFPIEPEGVIPVP